MIGIGEIIIIVVVIAVVIFGVKKIPELAKTLGRFKGEYQKGKKEVERELKETEGETKEEKESPK